MRWAVPVLMMGVLLSCCSTQEYDEWRWEQVDARTVIFEIPISFPSWMADEDKEPVMALVDDTWAMMLELIPEARLFDVTCTTVHIHDNLLAFWVPAAKSWCIGWAAGHHIQVAWGLDIVNGMPQGIASKNPLPALAHEWLHLILKQAYGWADPSHMMFPMFSERLDKIAALSMSVHLSEMSRIRAHLFRYLPEGLNGPEY